MFIDIIGQQKQHNTLIWYTIFLLFHTITNEKTVKFMQRDIITSTITCHLGLVGSNNFGTYYLQSIYFAFTYLVCLVWLRARIVLLQILLHHLGLCYKLRRLIIVSVIYFLFVKIFMQHPQLKSGLTVTKQCQTTLKDVIRWIKYTKSYFYDCIQN